MTITKPPEIIDVDKLIREETKQKNSICPICGETEKYEWTNLKEKGVQCLMIGHVTHRYGKQKPWYKHIFDKSHYWDTLCFRCHTCGTEWESDEFPIYMNDEISKEMLNEYKRKNV